MAGRQTLLSLLSGQSQNTDQRTLDTAANKSVWIFTFLLEKILWIWIVGEETKVCFFKKLGENMWKPNTCYRCHSQEYMSLAYNRWSDLNNKSIGNSNTQSTKANLWSLCRKGNPRISTSSEYPNITANWIQSWKTCLRTEGKENQIHDKIRQRSTNTCKIKEDN